MPSYTALTTLALVKSRLFPGGQGTHTDHDTLISELITYASAKIEDRLDRYLGDQTHTEYHDGRGQRRMYLNEGPLISVTTVEEIDYGGTTTRTEDPTTVEQAERLEGGLASEGHKGIGWLELINGLWIPGQRNYKIVYVGGFAAMPESIEGLAADLVVLMYRRREAQGVTSKTIGDGSIAGLLNPSQSEDGVDRQLGDFVRADGFVG